MASTSSRGKSFLVYFDLEMQTAHLTNEQMGKLFRAMLAYASRDECIELDDPWVQSAFNFVLVSIREDKIKYKNTCQQNSENARKRKDDMEEIKRLLKGKS